MAVSCCESAESYIEFLWSHCCDVCFEVQVLNGLLERPDWEAAIKMPIGIIPAGTILAKSLPSFAVFSGLKFASAFEVVKPLAGIFSRTPAWMQFICLCESSREWLVFQQLHFSTSLQVGLTAIYSSIVWGCSVRLQLSTWALVFSPCCFLKFLAWRHACCVFTFLSFWTMHVLESRDQQWDGKIVVGPYRGALWCSKCDFPCYSR